MKALLAAPSPALKPSESVDEKSSIEQLQHDFDALGLRERGVRILVVDDSTINRKLCSRKIRRFMPSVKVTECSSGTAALEEYESSPQTVMGIFMDYHMQDMDGDECTRRIRECESMNEGIHAHVYIAGYTADVLENSTGKLLNAGMNSVIPKPEPPRAVEDELRKMLKCYNDAHTVCMTSS